MDNKYLTYKSSSLAEESQFIEWVLEGKNDAEWKSWLAENQQMQTVVEEARKLILAFGFEADPDITAIENRLWSDIKSKTLDTEARNFRTIPMRRYITIAAVAASLILPFFIFFGGNNQLVKANPGEHLTYTLPDQSTLQLNSGSTIEYNNKKWNKKREVILKGEAFFEVEKGVPFEVVTNNGSVHVLGTSFNVFSRSKSFKVECKTGRVEVRTQDQSFILNPGDIVVKDEITQQLSLQKGDPTKPIDWLEGTYYFENTRLNKVFNELERQFNTQVRASKEVLNSRFTGSFEASNIDSALYQICWPMNLESSREGSKIIVKKRSLE